MTKTKQPHPLMHPCSDIFVRHLPGAQANKVLLIPFIIVIRKSMPCLAATAMCVASV